MATESKESSGVQQLIDRLRDEGVAKGRDEAEHLTTEARKQSMEILDKARQEAEEILAKARKEAERVKANGDEALRLASRDVILKLKESFHQEFENKVRRLVGCKLKDQSFLERLILEIARRSMPEDHGQAIEILLPADESSRETSTSGKSKAKDDSLSQFVLGLAADVLREGLTFGESGDTGTGVTIRLLEEDVEIELTEETVTALLMQFMLPRFRAILEQGT
jgi:V/A-type H+-transporting ATPase subunit E